MNIIYIIPTLIIIIYYIFHFIIYFILIAKRIHGPIQYNRFMFRKPITEPKIGNVYMALNGQLIKIVKQTSIIYSSYEDSSGMIWIIDKDNYNNDNQLLYDLNKRELKKHWPKIINDKF